MVIWSQTRILDHFTISITIAEWRILGDLLAFLMQSPADFYDTRQNDWHRQLKESNTFRSDTADIWIQI